MVKENLHPTLSLLMKTSEVLKVLEAQLRQNPVQFIKDFKSYNPVEGKYGSIGLADIISDDLMLNYNFKRTKKQLSFQALELCKILEAAWNENLMGNDNQKIIIDQPKAAHNKSQKKGS